MRAATEQGYSGQNTGIRQEENAGEPEGPRAWPPLAFPWSGSDHRVGERRLSPEWRVGGMSGFLYFGRRKLSSVITFGVSTFPVSQ